MCKCDADLSLMLRLPKMKPKEVQENRLKMVNLIRQKGCTYIQLPAEAQLRLGKAQPDRRAAALDFRSLSPGARARESMLKEGFIQGHSLARISSTSSE